MELFFNAKCLIVVDEHKHRFDQTQRKPQWSAVQYVCYVSHIRPCLLSASQKWQIDLCQGEWNSHTDTCPITYRYCILVRCARFAYVQFYKTSPHRKQTRPSHVMCISFSTCSEPTCLFRRRPCPQQSCSFITCALQPLNQKSTKETLRIIILKDTENQRVRHHIEGSAVTGEHVVRRGGLSLEVFHLCLITWIWSQLQ